MRLRGVKRPEDSKGPVSQLNNHRYLSDSVDMAWGALRGDDALFRQGIASFLLALAQMRADGSLPLETARGARALWYQRHAIASLVDDRRDGRGPGLRPLCAEPSTAAACITRRFPRPRARRADAGRALRRGQQNPGEFAN